MEIPFVVQGSRRPSLALIWVDEDETALNLTGATMTGVIEALLTGETREIDGDLTVTDGAAGAFRWDLGEEDVSEAGEFLVQFKATFGSEPTPARSTALGWRVERNLAG